jgi:flagellar motility protein MotE (MotC chaperone)
VHSALALSALLLAGTAATTPPTAPAAPLAAEPEAKLPSAPIAGAEPAPPKVPPSVPDRAAEPKPGPEKPVVEKAKVEGGDDAQERRVLPVKPTSEPRGEKVEGTAPARSYAVIPPALSSRALLDELRRTSKDRQADQTSLAQQSQKLQALQQDIEKSRAALREETTRLQGLVAAGESKARGGKATDRKGTAKGSLQPEPTPLESLAKTTRNMKPDQAAEMMTRLDRGLATAILTHMKPAEAALVLEKMEPATSAALVALLARKDRT